MSSLCCLAKKKKAVGGAGRKERGGRREWRRWEGGRAGKGQEGGFSAEENGKARRQQSEAGREWGGGWGL